MNTTHRAWSEIDLSALADNTAALRRLLPAGSVLMPAVKADAYGHGALPVAGALCRAGVRHFCVASLEEAAALRQAGIPGEVLILGYTHPDAFGELAQLGASQTVVDTDHARRLSAYAAAHGLLLPVHVGVDTGMHRLGLPWQDETGLLALWQLPGLCIRGVFSHLCVADSPDAADRAFTMRQAQRFFGLVQMLRRRGVPPFLCHLQGSYGLLHYPQLRCDAARVGLALYGVHSTAALRDAYQSGLFFAGCRQQAVGACADGADSAVLDPLLRGGCPAPACPPPAGACRPLAVDPPTGGAVTGGPFGPVPLRPVLQLKARITSLRTLQPGERLGYGLTWAAPAPCRVAAVAIGYADGLPRALSNRGCALVGGVRCPIVGRVCMDQLLLDVTHAPCDVGDVAVLIGRDGDARLDAEEVADAAGTITNELLCRLGPRLARVVLPAATA